MRIIVSGAAGFIGSHFCDRLLKEGHTVIGLDNFITGSLLNLKHLGNVAAFDFVEWDIIKPFAIDGPVDAVVNMASLASPKDYLEHPIETLEVGSLGTQHMLELALAKNARFLLTSTSECYGDPLEHPQAETYWGHVNPVGPRGVYDEAKRFAEALTIAYRNTHGVDTAIARIFNTFGPRMRPRDGRAIPTFIRQALRDEPITVAGEGTQTRSVCYVDDLIDGLVRLLHSDEPGPMNLGNPEELEVIELAQLIRRLANSSSPIQHIERPQDDPTVRRPDITLATTALGWKPIVDIDDGLGRTISWFATQPDC